MLEAKLRCVINEVPDFPKPGVRFRDIMPVFKSPDLCWESAGAMIEPFQNSGIEYVVGIESRGFLLGMLLAQSLRCSFLPVRKHGKLPPPTLSQSYNLEYGTAIIEMTDDKNLVGKKILIHDDILATGGTANAAASLIDRIGAKVEGFCFLAELAGLDGRNRLEQHSATIVSLIKFE